MRITTGILVLALLLPVSPLAVARDAHAASGQRSAGAEFGLGVTAVVCSVVYGPVKTVYAVLGTIAGGMAWVFTTGDRHETARRIIQPALRGDYVVTPEHLTNDDVLSFVGRDPTTDPYPYN